MVLRFFGFGSAVPVRSKQASKSSLAVCRPCAPRGAGALARDVAVDLGTSFVRVYVREKGIVAEEPAVVAVDDSNEVVAVGHAAVQATLQSSRQSKAHLVRPLRHGVIDDERLAQRMLSKMLRPHLGGFLERTRLLVCVPSSSTSIERRVMREVTKRSGASSVELIEQVLAAAIGADLPVHEPVGTLVVDAGAGVTEAALISLGYVVARSSARTGGVDVDAAVRNTLRREYGMVVDDRAAEELKFVVSRLARGSDLLIEARGTLAIDGSSVTAIIERDELLPAVATYLAAVVDAVKQCLVQASPELGQDLAARGLHLIGGGASLCGLSDRLRLELGVPVHVAADPERAVIRGAGKCIEALDNLRDLFV